ncbi:MAG: STAS domain-containing protein, partial [Phycisphaerales bacterium]|nr:STAS domain-containing protein [Phycisphaerales bacterium]
MTEASFVSVEKVGGACVARVMCPTVGQREAPIIEQELLAAGPGHGWRVAIDMSGVGMLTSVGIGTLVTVNKKCREGKGRMALFGLNDTIMDVLKLTRLDKLFPIARDR